LLMFCGPYSNTLEKRGESKPATEQKFAHQPVRER
jgi:hypothetical protein